MENSTTITTGRKLFVLVGSAVGLTVLASLIASAILLFGTMTQGGNIATAEPNILFLKISQLVITILTFFVPVLLLSKTCGIKNSAFVKADKSFTLPLLLLGVVVIISIQPFMNATADWFSHWSLPPALSWLEQSLKEMEARNLELVSRFLDVHSVGALLFNIVVVAIAPAICEEFFFRGGLQQVFAEKMNRHVAIWLTAVIFSAVHMEVAGFLPRVMLGACFGYLFVWSGTIWLPVVAHFINNLVGVVAEYLMYNHFVGKNIEQIGTGDTFWITGCGLVLFVVALGFIFRQREGKQSLAASGIR
jgi:membrane protease YdiL (CAAX protease family)